MCSKFGVLMFEVFDVRYFGVHSKTNVYEASSLNFTTFNISSQCVLAKRGKKSKVDSRAGDPHPNGSHCLRSNLVIIGLYIML